MREITEHRRSGDYLLHQNPIPNGWFERSGYLFLKSRPFFADNFRRRIRLGQSTPDEVGNRDLTEFDNRAGIRMANPPSNYPPEWTDGGGAFGRLYGNAIATQTSKRTAAFLTESVLHEDPRYLPAPQDASAERRIVHALAFTIVDRTDSGRRTFAFANFASAAAGGFVGMAYLPDGFNDTSHAGQRALSGLLGIGVANISREFAPQWGPFVRKLHIPRVVPVWWVPEHQQHP